MQYFVLEYISRSFHIQIFNELNNNTTYLKRKEILLKYMYQGTIMRYRTKFQERLLHGSQPIKE